MSDEDRQFDMLIARVARLLDLPERYLRPSPLIPFQPVESVATMCYDALSNRWSSSLEKVGFSEPGIMPWPTIGTNPCEEIEMGDRFPKLITLVTSPVYVSKTFIFHPYVPLQVTQVAASVDRSRFPHVCPRCGEAAYVGMAEVDCSAGCV